MVRLNRVFDKWMLEDYTINQQNRIFLNEQGLIDTLVKIKEELRKLGYIQVEGEILIE